MRGSPLYSRYAQAPDPESAFEVPTARQTERDAQKQTEAEAEEAAARTGRRGGGPDASMVDQVLGSGIFKALARSLGTQIRREISRSVCGTRRRC